MIRTDLLEAYMGFYEERRDALAAYAEEKEINRGLAMPSYTQWLASYCENLIRHHSPQKRLAIYLEWNGICGFTHQIYDIATGKIHA